MVTLSTFSCGHNVYVSAQSFKHYSCCFRTPLVRFLGPWPNFVYMFTCKFPAARCRPWLLLSDGFYTCSTMSRRGGGAMWGIRFVRMGRGGGMAESRWAGTMLIRKDHQLVGIHVCPCPYQEETETRSFHYNNILIGGIAIVIYM